jgi:hypothetical protein
MVLDVFKVRYNRMRKRIADWVETVKSLSEYKFIMITLTYAPAYDWEANHIREFMLTLKKLLGKKLLAYAWVAEMQKRGVVHYHVMLVVPDGLIIGEDLPYPDDAGLWRYGLTRVEVARSPFYLVKYLGKEHQKDFSKFPKGIRAFSVQIYEPVLKKKLRYLSLREYEKAFVDEHGWEELNYQKAVRKLSQITSGENWELCSFEKDKKSAVTQAEWWEEDGYKWEGRKMFVQEKTETEKGAVDN